jgi:hypothetical protein
MTSRAALLTLVVGDHVLAWERRLRPAPEKVRTRSRVQASAARPQPIEEPQQAKQRDVTRDTVRDPIRDQTRYLIDQFNAVPAPPTGPDFSSPNPWKSQR